MGYSTFELYMEDTYQIEGQPYFGYFRGAYSARGVAKSKPMLNSLAHDLCTMHPDLGHLSGLREMGCQEGAELRDVEDILLIGEEKVYDLIDGMFATLSKLKIS